MTRNVQRCDARSIALGLLIVVLSVPSFGAAQKGDGLYGRFDRDMQVSIGAGGGALIQNGVARGVTAFEVRGLLLDAAGPFVALQYAPNAPEHFIAGIDIRPLFPALFFLNKSTGRRFFDLFLQSINLELGAFWLLDGQRDVGLLVGFGFELPFVGEGRGVDRLSLRIGARHAHISQNDRQTKRELRTWSALATLVFRFGIGRGLITKEPPRYRVR